MKFPASLLISTLLVAGVAASLPAIAQTEVPITNITFIGMYDGVRIAQLIVPDRDTTRSAYGGRLRRYDVHIAKMFELTHYECQDRDRNWSRVMWHYKAGGGDIDMGNFEISCSMAAGARNAYGLGKPEATPVTYYRARATVNVPILNITGGKVATWMNFTKNFRPEFGD